MILVRLLNYKAKNMPEGLSIRNTCSEISKFDQHKKELRIPLCLVSGKCLNFVANRRSK